jgi:hypothetical protein
VGKSIELTWIPAFAGMTEYLDSGLFLGAAIWI